MKFKFLPFFGVPCCERLSHDKLWSIWSESLLLLDAPSPVQADLLMVVGQVTHKQSPYLQNLWAAMSYPSHCIHVQGCASPLRNYSLIEDLSKIIEVKDVVQGCPVTQRKLEITLRSLN